jgi:hypothetical protein
VETFLEELLSFFFYDGRLQKRDVYRILAMIEDCYR